MAAQKNGKRKREKRNRHAVVMLRMFPAEKKLLQEAADKRGRQLSTWIRDEMVDRVRAMSPE